MTVTILTHDARWKGLGPAVKRAVEATLVALQTSGWAPSSPLEGEPNPLADLVGGKRGKKVHATKRKIDKKSPHQKSKDFWLPLKGGAGEYASPVCLTILLTNDAEIKTFNAQYRAKNKPTNVLSFPDGDVVDGVTQLGDIALAYETITREAAEQGKLLKHHISHLSVHGVLHLLGYDHEADRDAKAMETLEIAILARMGIANPYECG